MSRSHHRGRRDRITFELAEDERWDDDAVVSRQEPTSDDRSTETASGPEDEAVPTADPARGATRRRRRRAGLAVAAVAVVVVGGMVAVDALSSRPDLAALRDSAGGVEPIGAAPTERWSQRAPLLSGFATLPGLFVVTEGDEAVAYDLDTGAVRWSVPLPEGSTCGDTTFWWADTAQADDTLVCVTPDQPSILATRTVVSSTTDADAGAPVEAPVDPAEVTVLDVDGEVVAARTVDAARGWSTVGPDGSVARFRRVGDVPDGAARFVETDPTGLPRDTSAGRPAVVTLEDAVTGEVRWERELPFVATDGMCAQHAFEEGTTYADLDGAQVVPVSRGLMVVNGCGIDAWLTPDGTRLDDPASPRDGLAVHAVADGTVVLRTMDVAVVGIDVETGRERWSLTPEELGDLVDDGGTSSGAPEVMIDQVFTDGAVAVAVVASWTDSTSWLVALDLRDGHVVWRAEATAAMSYLAVQGRLLRTDLSTTTRLG